MTESFDSEPGVEVEFIVVANGMVAVGVACTGSPRVVVLSGLEDDAELAGRATIPWKELMMPRRAVRERVMEGIVAACLCSGC